MLPEHLILLRDLVLKKLEYSLTDSQLQQFSLYADLLMDWNQKINLTSIVEPREIVVKHFLDSLTLMPWINGDKVADIGTGAGFPGIPLKIVYPDKNFVLIDSLAKRLDFLNVVIQKIDLNKIETIHSRAEDFGRNNQYRSSFDTVVSRAVAKLPVLLEYSIPLLRVGGVFLAAKGSQGDEEVAESGNALSLLGAEIKDICKLNLGEGADNRAIIIIEKIKPTPSIYPRKPGTPAKKPL
ncbi:16S rRNA (guanine(527)-N(7))-methyltransferase RsmG [Desulfitobacterium sp. Sab5]|uniref:16S rRNA (guanine(527)-N(7))-methyltransferase RsmG n=1 Tax=Desulfitobacterium nosdiversum TaxID=3375356 RepID=UPI003CF6200A